MTAHDEVEAAGWERQLLGVRLFEPDRDTERLGLAPRLGDHRGREVDTDDVMPTGRELEAEESGAATGVERLELAAAGQHQIEDAIPRGALGRRADAVAEVLVEVRRPPVPVGGDLLLDVHGIFSMTSIWAPSGASRKQTRRPLVGVSSSRMRTPLARRRASVAE